MGCLFFCFNISDASFLYFSIKLLATFRNNPYLCKESEL